MNVTDVVAVLSTPQAIGFVSLTVLAIAALLVDAWRHRASTKPSTERISDAEIRAIFQPRPFSLPAKKGFHADYQHTVVPFSKERTQ